jgi:hypothetical protein
MPNSPQEKPFMTDLKVRLDLVEESEFAELRGMKLNALRNERSRGGGPPFFKVGRKCFYQFEAVKAFIEGGKITPTRTPTLIEGNNRRRVSRVGGQS